MSCEHCEDGFVILNLEWPNGVLPYRERCSECLNDEDEERFASPSPWRPHTPPVGSDSLDPR